MCRLHIQESQRGHIYYEQEYWVERYIQLCKTRVRARAHEQPEKLLANYLIESSALQRTRAADSSLAVIDDILDDIRGVHVMDGESTAKDEPHIDGYMLFKGRPPTESEKQVIQKAISGHYTSLVQGDKLDEALLPILDNSFTDTDIWVHTAAQIREEEVITSRQNRRSRTRDSSHVKALYLEANGMQRIYIAVVSMLVRVLFHKNGQSSVSRFALCDFYKTSPSATESKKGKKKLKMDEKIDLAKYGMKEHVNDDTGVMQYVDLPDDLFSQKELIFSHRDFFVPLTAIQTKVVVAKQQSPGGPRLFFLDYSFASGLN